MSTISRILLGVAFFFLGILVWFGIGQYLDADEWSIAKWTMLVLLTGLFVAREQISFRAFLILYSPAIMLSLLNCARFARWNALYAIPVFLIVCIVALSVSLFVIRRAQYQRLLFLYNSLFHIRDSFLSQYWSGFSRWFLRPHIVALLVFPPVVFTWFRYIQFYDFYTAIYRKWEYNFTGIKSGSLILWMQGDTTVECLPMAAGVGTLVFIAFGLGNALKQRLTIRQMAGSAWYWAVVSLLFPAWLFAVNNWWNYVYVDAGDRFDWYGDGNYLGFPNPDLLLLCILHVGGAWLGLTGPILALRFGKSLGIRVASFLHLLVFFAAMPAQYVHWIAGFGWGAWLPEIPVLCMSAMLQPIYLQKLLEKKQHSMNFL
ncbi:MAG: hypothetical protein ACR2IE_18840 [Candidatus Sumerlaeaceae bacterium]